MNSLLETAYLGKNQEMELNQQVGVYLVYQNSQMIKTSQMFLDRDNPSINLEEQQLMLEFFQIQGRQQNQVNPCLELQTLKAVPLVFKKTNFFLALEKVVGKQKRWRACKRGSKKNKKMRNL